MALAQEWGFNQVEQLCVYQAFRLDRSLLAESFINLTTRPEPLDLGEAKRLGIETTLQIARARELSRGSNSGTRPSAIRLNDPELRSLIRDAFSLEEEPLFDSSVGDAFS